MLKNIFSVWNLVKDWFGTNFYEGDIPVKFTDIFVLLNAVLAWESFWYFGVGNGLTETVEQFIVLENWVFKWLLARSKRLCELSTILVCFYWDCYFFVIDIPRLCWLLSWSFFEFWWCSIALFSFYCGMVKFDFFPDEDLGGNFEVEALKFKGDWLTDDVNGIF